jgi:pimeloyl-ACP methyl ester carboxylesterase
MIEREAHRIAFHVTPGHAPAIVLDAGGGEDSTYWDTLVPVLLRKTGCEIITYDRAGFGGSDEVDGPWGLQSATEDLAAGLKKLGITPGIVLVAHSLAGEIATNLVRQHPHWVSGAVLVDANVPEFFTKAEITRQFVEYAPVIASVKKAPPSREGRQLLAVAASFEQTSNAFHKMSWPKSVPVIVIVSEKTPFASKVDAQAWKRAHEKFAERAANRKFVIAKGSSHDVAHDRPDVVIDAVLAMVRQTGK